MDELISKQAAIDAMINSRSNADVTLVPGSYTNGWRDGRKLLLDELLQVVFELPPAQQWIPVTERLPEAGVRYQVTFESGEVGYADFRNKIFLWDGSAKENVWETERYYEDDEEVIAWMPLPKPYERSE